MENVIYISKGGLFLTDGGTSVDLPCEAVEKYKKTIAEVNQKKDWKTKGSGAMFMYGAGVAAERAVTNANVTGAAFSGNEIIYSAVLDNSSAIYKRSVSVSEHDENIIIRKQDLKIFDLSLCKANGNLAASAGTGYARNIIFIAANSVDLNFLTEGDSIDSNPAFDPKNPDVIYFDSCGIAYYENGFFLGVGPRSIAKLNTAAGSLDDVLTDDNYDFFKPKCDSGGNMYCIKRPYKDTLRNKASLKDVFLAPFKIIKAIIGWLDYFTKSYAGESLKTKGGNPARSKNLSEKEIFIENNLINVEKSLAESKQAGNQYPGIAPNNWQLIKVNAAGEQTVVKKGVLDYAITQNGDIVFSNGKFILMININEGGKEEILCKADLATKIGVY